MRRLEVRYGIPWRTFWALRYRPPSDLFVSAFERIKSAYLTECARQQRMLAHEVAIAEAKGIAVAADIRALAALDQNEGKEVKQ